MKPEVKKRMEDLINRSELLKYRGSLISIIEDLFDEGFDKKDIKEYLSSVIDSELFFQFLKDS